jgi:hypothetical protein
MPATWWERIIYQLALAFWRAFFDVQEARHQAEEETPDEKAHARALRFRDAVNRLRQRSAGDPVSGSPAPARPPGEGNDLGKGSGREDARSPGDRT